MQKTCTRCQTSFEVAETDLAFFESISPIFGGKKYTVPAPLRCPPCRKQLRMMFRNLRRLYKRKCDLTGESIISGYAPDSAHSVYKSEHWWGDQWNGFTHGRDFDFHRPFFEQFKELYHDVPVIHQYGTHLENCDYINGAAKCKDCYLCFNLDYCEGCSYIADAMHSRFCFDCLSIEGCELCYECISCNNCYHLFFSERSANCSDSAFLFDCRRCKNCIACCDLTDKEFHIFNQPVSPEVFERKKTEMLSPANLKQTEQQAVAFQLKLPKKYYTGLSNENFTGENLHHAKNCFECFDGSEMENCRYCHYNYNVHNCMDHTIYGDGSEWIYNCLATGTSCAHNSFCMFCWNGSHDNLYCHLVNSCSNCFGCSGLKSQKYCIFNKQYGKDEYESLVPKIIEHMQKNGEWGEFFPEDLCPFAYNETVAHEYFPLTKNEALRSGYRWREETDEVPNVTKIIPAEKLPEEIQDVPDDVLQWAIASEKSGRPFKILKNELVFYRNEHLPLPHFHPDERHLARIAERNPRQLWKRNCAKCSTEFMTCYAPDRPEIVYCESCYLKEVY